MRRISLALALLGAVAAAGCGVNPQPPPQTTSPGVEGKPFTLSVRGEGFYAYTDPQGLHTTMLPTGGKITGGGLDCGMGPGLTTGTTCSVTAVYGSTVTLQTQFATGYGFVMFGGSVSGNLPSYPVLVSSDKFVAVRFATSVGGLGAHPNFSQGRIHIDEYMRWGRGEPGALNCYTSSCHGTAGQGAGLAPACTKCHAATPPAAPESGTHAMPFPAASHGPAYVADGASCKTCHGADLLGGGALVSCGGCHLAPVVSFLAANTAATPHAAGNPALPALFAGLANGAAVTTICVDCHESKARDFMQTQHWSWKGPTPDLYSVSNFQFVEGLSAQVTGTNVGKANLINNFCVSVTSNEKRCEQCHAGYGTTTSARSGANASDPTRVDCLICHTGNISGKMLAGTSATDLPGYYNKIAGNFGNAGWKVGDPNPSVNVAATASHLQAWASNIRLPNRDNCGYCHFNAGGADSVKIMSTELVEPISSVVDVHMASLANGGQGMTCSGCHADSNHKVKGAGVHVPTSFARLACTDCHGTPHLGTAMEAVLDGHLDTVACQTCHIPRFATDLPQKTDWDWSTAGWKTAAFPHPATIYACVSADGQSETPYDGANCGDNAKLKVKKYDYMKGTFDWRKNVTPTYAWYNGKTTHVLTTDKGAFTAETGTTPALADRITLSAPLGSKADPTAKIFPFKVMTGRQAVYVDDAAGQSFIITPKLFQSAAADGGFWGVLAAQPPGTNALTYAYESAVTTDAFGAPDGSLTGTFASNYAGYAATGNSIETLLSNVFTKGAVAAGQVAAGTTIGKYVPAGADPVAQPAVPGWDWRYTKMYMDLEHEVAPKASALGCTACHNETADPTPTPFFLGVGYDCDPRHGACSRTP